MYSSYFSILDFFSLLHDESSYSRNANEYEDVERRDVIRNIPKEKTITRTRGNEIESKKNQDVDNVPLNPPSDMNEIEWSFFLVNHISFDLSKIVLQPSKTSPIKAFRLSSKTIELHTIDFMKRSYPSLDWNDDIKNFQKVKSYLQIDSGIKESKFKLSYSEANYKIKISKIMKKNKLLESWSFEICNADDSIDLNSIISKSFDMIYFFEVIEEKGDEVITLEASSQSVDLKDKN